MEVNANEQNTDTSSESTVFDEPSSTTDVCLIVEGRKLYVNSGVLSVASPAFERIFHGDFKEKGKSEIELPDKSYDDFVEMLLCIYPSQMKPIDSDKVRLLLKLADEYQIEYLLRCCKQILLDACTEMKNHGPRDKKEVAQILRLAEHYNLDKIVEMALDVACEMTFRYIRKSKNTGYSPIPSIADEEDFKALSEKTLLMYFRKRVEFLEQKYNYM